MSEDVKSNKVLIVEDTLMIRKLLCAVLGRNHFEVAEAEHGKAGLEAVAVSVPDIVLCDLFMPEMDGKSFLRAMKSSQSNAHVPVVILSADVEPELETELLGMGAAAVLNKSASHAELIAAVQSLLKSNVNT